MQKYNILSFLKAQGFSTVFGIPGSGSSVLLPLLNEYNVKLILNKTELSAAYSAISFYLTSKRPAGCLVTSGPGVFAVVPGIITAKYEYALVIFLTVVADNTIEGITPFQDATGNNNSISQKELISRLCIYSATINSTLDLRTVMSDLKIIFLKINAGLIPPGPIYIEISDTFLRKDDFLQMYDLSDSKVNVPLNNTINAKIREVVFLIETSKKPILLCGGGAKIVEKKCLELAKTLDIPIVSTIKGKSIYLCKDPHYKGVIGISNPSMFNAIKDVDLVIAIGFSNNQLATYSGRFPGARTTILLNTPHTEYPSIKRNNVHCVQGPINTTLSLLIQAIKKKQIYKNNDFHKPEYYRSGLFNTTLQYVRSYIQSTSKKYIICTELITETHFFETEYITFANLAPIGCAIAGAVGAKIAKPTKYSIAICGDTGFYMDFAEILSARDERLPIGVILRSNNAAGPIYKAQIAKNGIAYMSTFHNCDFEALSKSFGITYFKITSRDEIQKVIPQFLQQIQQKCALLEVYDDL